MGKVTNPFAAVKKASGEVPNEVEELERPEYVEDTDTTEEAADEVPEGTAKEVMNWVGDDKDRAQRALDAEEAKGDDGRKGLKRDLSAMLED